MRRKPSKRSRHSRDVRRYERNILQILALATLADIESGCRWYADARAWAYAIAVRYTVTPETVVRVMAALSPRNKWQRNLRDAEACIRAYRDGDCESTVTVCTFNGNRSKAFRILAGERFESGPKVTAFVDNILREDSTAVTVDVHARKVAEAARVSSDDMVTLTPLRYRLMEQAYRNVADRYGIRRPYMLQAICWLTWKRIHEEDIRQETRKRNRRIGR